MAPYNIKPALDNMHAFLEPVPENQRVFMAFDDPGTTYEKIFDGWRQLIELPSYVANQRKILFMPEWWGVFELNYEDAPEIWGREPEQLRANMQHWGSQFGIVYQSEGGELDPKWQAAGFQHRTTFDWNAFEPDFSYHKRYGNLQLKFFLLEDQTAQPTA